jgi:WD40 repeat protein
VGVAPYNPLPAGFGLTPVWLPDGRLLLISGVDTGTVRHDVFDGRGYGISEHLENVTIWDVATGTLPDGTVFVAGAGYDGMVYLVDAATGAELTAPLTGLEDQALAVAVVTLSDGTVMIAAGGDDRRVLRWDARTGRRIGSPLTGHETGVARLAFVSPPGGTTILVSLDQSGELRRWDATTGAPIGEPVQVCGEEVGSLRLAVTCATPAPEVITVGDDDVVRRWDASTGRLVHEVAEASAATVLTLPGDRIVHAVGGPDGSISIGPLPSDR